MPEPGTDESSQVAEDRGRFGTLGTAIGALVAAWGAVIASFPLNDNSFFTHLATGRLILDRGSVPSSDPYTFTAQGADWTVQSWLASVVYAGAERVGGELGLRAVILALLVAAALLVWRLSAGATSLLLRLLIAAGAMFVATGLWGERPYMVGVIGLGLVWLALEDSFNPWLLVPFLWVWANSHGSFPLATVFILTVLAGEVLDRRGNDRQVSRVALATELRVLAMTVLGTLLAVVGPLGLDVLTFPLKALTQSDVLASIIEWQPPAYRSWPERAFLVLVLATLAALTRRGTWRMAIPVMIFAGAGLYAQRNIVLATMVLVPVLAACAPRLGTLTSSSRPSLGPAFSGMCAGLVVLVAAVGVTSPAAGFGGYPAEAIAWLGPLDAPEPGEAVVTDVATGNLLGVLDGATGAVFVDDRADMYPSDVFEDHLDLLRGDPEWETILDHHDIGYVVWERTRPLASLLAVSEEWQTVFADSTWAVTCRRGPACDSLAP